MGDSKPNMDEDERPCDAAPALTAGTGVPGSDPCRQRELHAADGAQGS